MQHAACDWPLCCDMLGIENCELLRMLGCNIVARTWPNDHNIMQHPQMLHEKFGQFKFGSTTPNMSQHVAPTNVAFKCCVRLAGFLKNDQPFCALYLPND